MNKLSQKEVDRRAIAAMSGHIPGKVHTLSDGTQYRVLENGSWKRITIRHCNIKLGKLLEHSLYPPNNGVRRRSTSPVKRSL